MKFHDENVIHEFREYQIAPNIPPKMQLMNETRVLAALDSSTGPKKFYAGVVGETLCRSNDYNYLIFFDNGHVRYVPASDVRVVKGDDRWIHVHQNASLFLRYYFNEKDAPMLSEKIGTTISVEYLGKLHSARIAGVHGDLLIQITYIDINRKEWLYRGSPRIETVWIMYTQRKKHPTNS